MQEITQPVTISPGDSATLSYSFGNLQPGFYTCSWDAMGEQKAKVNFGFEPENIVSLPDHQPDLRAFWDKALDELAQIPVDYTMTLDKEKSNHYRSVYLVSMRSLGGDTIRGYLTTPKVVKGKKYPTIIYYMGYGSKPWNAHPDALHDWVEFVVSTRGQGLNEPTNQYGDWIQYHLDDVQSYYYRGAFMDAVRAIDFVSSLSQVDTRNIFAEGGSQGGALTLLAACALDPWHRINCATPWVPFLNDYPDYFKIVPWPRSAVVRKQQELGMDDEELYRNLTYFDLKNLARWIECPIFMSCGLQDPVCPPHTNFASYNLISTEKSFKIYPKKGHDVEHPDYENNRLDFFKKHFKK